MQDETRECEVCGQELYWVKHLEPAGDNEYTDESYWECPEGCEYPTVADDELTNDELLERYGEYTLEELAEKGLKIKLVEKDKNE